MEKLSVKQQGVKGGNPTWKEDVGYISAFVGDSKSISVDAFSGHGRSYKRRDTPQIIIKDGSNHFTFDSFDELVMALKTFRKQNEAARSIQ